MDDIPGTSLHGSGQFICTFVDCAKTFSKRSRLKHHLMTHTGERPYRCSLAECGKRYVRAAHLKRHVQMSHKSRPPCIDSICCTEAGCEKLFGCQDALNKHRRTVHHGRLSYKCTVAGCEESFRKKSQLRVHHFWHKGVLPYQCEHAGCRKQFAQKSHLDRHQKIHQGYVCTAEGCAEVFPLFSLLRKHKAHFHKKATLRCPECSAMFARVSLLTRHARTHSEGEDLHCCPEPDCTRSYLTMGSLKAHINSHHRGYRFSCQADGCHKTLATKQKLQQHMKLHDPSVPKNERRGHRKGGVRRHHIVTKITGVPTSELTNVSLAVLHDKHDADRDTAPSGADGGNLNKYSGPVRLHGLLHAGSGDNQASVTSECGDVTSECGDVTSECGDVTSECGDVTSECSDVTSECDDVTSECGDVTSECGDVTSECEPYVASKLIVTSEHDREIPGEKCRVTGDHVTTLVSCSSKIL